MKKEKSCGILVFEGNKVLMVKHRKGHWGFPKGHVEAGETEEETAIREVKEETNCDAKIIEGFRKTINYNPKEDVNKDVIFFVGEPITKNIVAQEEEVSDVLFVPIKEAAQAVTYDEEKEVLKEAIEFMEEL